jgi:hypothetical protein
VKRIDYIRALWKGDATATPPKPPMSRGDIARHLTEITGKKVQYQIVNAAVKSIPGGPPKVAAAEAAPATPPAETPAR